MPVRGICVDGISIKLNLPSYTRLADKLIEEADQIENAIVSGWLERHMHQESIDLMIEAATAIRDMVQEIERS